MSLIKCLKNYFKSHILVLLFSIFIVISVTLLSLVPPQLLRIIVDDIIPSNNINRLLIFAIIYTLCFILINLINFLKEVLLVIISQGLGKNIRLEMLNKVNKLTYINFNKFDSGTLESYFSNDVDEINTLITSGVISMIIDSFKMIGLIISIFVFSPLFGLIILGISPILIIFTMWIRKRMFKAQKRNRKLEANVNNLVLENLDNIVTIKSFRIYDKIIDKFDKVLKNHFDTNQEANNYDSMFSPIIQMTKTTLIVLIIILSSANTNLFGLTIGMLVSMIDLITDLFSPIESIGMEIQTIQKSIAAIDRINSFFKLEEDDNKDIDSIINSDDLCLEFKDVSYSYDGKTEVIEDFNLKLNNNDSITLKGKSGSGKSTLFKLSYGLIKPSSGKVTINGIDTYKLSNDAKRKVFGIVYQDYFFSLGTIKEELTLLDNSISDEKIYETLKEVGLDRIKDINSKFNINDYSTGELSLFNIARAVILDSKILFLDEMNSKIDSISAKRIIDVINNLSKKRMVLSINHYGELLNNTKVLNIEKI